MEPFINENNEFFEEAPSLFSKEGCILPPPLPTDNLFADSSDEDSTELLKKKRTRSKEKQLKEKKKQVARNHRQRKKTDIQTILELQHVIVNQMKTVGSAMTVLLQQQDYVIKELVKIKNK